MGIILDEDSIQDAMLDLEDDLIMAEYSAREKETGGYRYY
jgi:hypothetical protein